MGKAFRRHQSELGRMAADRIGKLRAPPNQMLANPEQHLRGLLLDALDRNKAGARTAHRLAICLRVGRVVLAAAYIRLHMLRCHQHRLMAQRRQRTRPVVRAAARLQSDPDRR